MNVLDLFSGIGGFSLGLERAGMRTVAFCEIESFPRRVLAKHWPHVPCYDDVQTLTASRLVSDGIGPIDVICGGFPCQDVSLAGAREGLAGKRSGLWVQYARLVGELRPRFVIVENTPGLLSLGMGTVLGHLAALGYDAEWHCISASAIGADHIRDRVWIIAYANGPGLQVNDIGGRLPRPAKMGPDAADLDGARSPRRLQTSEIGGNDASFGARIRLAVESADDFPGEHWNHKPVLGRRLHGIPYRLDRVKALGNAVVPQIPEIIGRAIMASLKY